MAFLIIPLFDDSLPERTCFASEFYFLNVNDWRSKSAKIYSFVFVCHEISNSIAYNKIMFTCS